MWPKRDDSMRLDPKAVKEIMRIRGVSTSYVLSRLIDRDKNEVKAWVDGKRGITRPNAHMIADALDCDIEHLTGQKPFVPDPELDSTTNDDKRGTFGEDGLDLILLNRIIESKYPHMTFAARCIKISTEMGRYFNIRSKKMDPAYHITVERWLNGKQMPDPNALKILAQTFGCTVKQLLGQECHPLQKITTEDQLRQSQQNIHNERPETSDVILNNALQSINAGQTLPSTERDIFNRELFKKLIEIMGLLSILLGIVSASLTLAGFPIAALIVSGAGFMTCLVCILILALTNATKAAFILFALTCLANLGIAIRSGVVISKMEEKYMIRSDDRAVAEYIKSIDGLGEVEDQNGAVYDIRDMPATGVIYLTKVDLEDNPKTNNNSLKNLAQCTNITWLRLDGTNINNIGVANLKHTTKLIYLGLGRTAVTRPC